MRHIDEDENFRVKLDIITLEEYHRAIIKLEDILVRNPRLVENCYGFDFKLETKIINTLYTPDDEVKHWICINPVVMI